MCPVFAGAAGAVDSPASGIWMQATYSGHQAWAYYPYDPAHPFVGGAYCPVNNGTSYFTAAPGTTIWRKYIVINNQPNNDSVSYAITGIPAGWGLSYTGYNPLVLGVIASNNAMGTGAGSSKQGFGMMIVSIPAGTAPGRYPYTIMATSGTGYTSNLTDAIVVGTGSTPAPSPDAKVAGASLPAAMVSGQAYPVSITMRNTGGMAWNASSRFRLGAQGNATLFGPQRYVIAPGVEVLPGQEYTFTFNMTAPATGPYQPQYRMVWEGKQWFGETLSSPVSVRARAPDAVMVSDSIPGSMVSGQSYPVEITVKNTGEISWNASSRFRLGAQGNATLFGPQRYVIAPGVEVLPGQEYTFTFNMTAPATGPYQPQYRMVWEGKQWFGETLSKGVQVSSGLA